jgi:hypothetical protein
MLVSFLSEYPKYVRRLLNHVIVYIQVWLYIYSSSLQMCQENAITVRKVDM